jgi:hypothetical protein
LAFSSVADLLLVLFHVLWENSVWVSFSSSRSNSVNGMKSNNSVNGKMVNLGLSNLLRVILGATSLGCWAVCCCGLPAGVATALGTLDREQC